MATVFFELDAKMCSQTFLRWWRCGVTCPHRRTMASAEQKKGTDKMSLSHSDEHLIQNGDKVILRKENNIQIATVQKNK